VTVLSLLFIQDLANSFRTLIIEDTQMRRRACKEQMWIGIGIESHDQIVHLKSDCKMSAFSSLLRIRIGSGGPLVFVCLIPFNFSDSGEDGPIIECFHVPATIAGTSSWKCVTRRPTAASP
jgi:hypothetical protein